MTQFDDDSHKSKVDRHAADRGSFGLEKIGYGLWPGWSGFVTYNLLTSPCLVLLGLLIGTETAFAAVPWLLITPALSRWVHPFLHRDHVSAVRSASWPLSLLLKSRYGKKLARHHFLHHKYPDTNFNLLMGGDWLFGVHRRATVEDLDEMREIGLSAD